MRKNVLSRIVNRTIAIVIAAMIAATSLPTTAFAETGDSRNTENTENIEETTTTEEITLDEAIEILEEIVDVEAEEQTGETEAPAEVAETVENTPQAELEEVQELVEEAAGDIEEVIADLTEKDETGKNAAEHLQDAKEAADEADEAAEAAKDELEEISENLQDYAASEDYTETAANADSAVEKAEKANKTDSKEEAYEAQAQAQDDLAAAETGLQNAVEAFEQAENNISEIEEQKAVTEQEYEKAEESLAAAKEALTSAHADAEAAQEKLAQAKVQMDELAAKVEKYNEQAEELTEIRDQYYDLMVYYYRSMLGYDKDTVYNEDGTLDIAANAEKFDGEAGAAKINEKAEKPGEMVLLGRYVTKLLVEYMINNDEDVIPGSAEITFGAEGKNSVEMQKAVQLVNANGHDQALIGNVNQKKWDSVEKKYVTPEEKEQVKWNSTNNKDNGRSNYVVVTYRDKNGELQTRNYNYVLKNSKYGDELDIENGMFYLAEVDGTQITRIENDNNLDNFTRLEKVLEAAVTIERYTEAQKAVNAAGEKVQTLMKEIDRLQSTQIDKSALTALENALETAKEDLEKAREEKNALEDKVQEAREAVSAINLSRFENEDVQAVDTVRETAAVVNSNEQVQENTSVTAEADDQTAEIVAEDTANEVQEKETVKDEKETAAEVKDTEDDKPVVNKADNGSKLQASVRNTVNSPVQDDAEVYGTAAGEYTDAVYTDEKAIGTVEEETVEESTVKTVRGRKNTKAVAGVARKDSSEEASEVYADTDFRAEDEVAVAGTVQTVKRSAAKAAAGEAEVVTVNRTAETEVLAAAEKTEKITFSAFVKTEQRAVRGLVRLILMIVNFIARV